MMQTGIFTGYFPYGLEETATKIRALDFNTVQLDMHFKDVDVSAGQITKDKCVRIRDTFRDHNLPISCISGYTNIIHPDKAERNRRVGYLKEIISHAQHLGTPYVISETGTYNTEEQDGGRLRGVPEGRRRSCPACLRSRRGLPARNLCE
jgi:sugar phosphate isomerase/epimerase